jgi:long-chain fatty acid transport protein
VKLLNTPTAVLLLLTASSPALADGGMFSGSKGARATGRGGAFVAKADDLSAAHFNPAGFVHTEGLQLQLGNRFSYNAHSFKRQATLDWGNEVNGVPPYVEFSTVRNQTPWQALEPLVGVASGFGLQDWVFAYVAYAPPGIGRQKFPIDGGQRYMMVERDSIVLNHTLNAAWRASDSFGLGVSLQWIYVPKLNYSLIIDASVYDQEVNPVTSTFDVLAELEGSDSFTPNAIVGAWYRPLPFLELGLSGQVIPAQIETDSKLNVSPLTERLAESGVDLRRGGEAANDVKLRLPLPLTARRYSLRAPTGGP